MIILGKIVAILNESQVLAKAVRQDSWVGMIHGDELLVLGSHQVAPARGGEALPAVIHVPKGGIGFEARQEDASLAILSTSIQRRRMARQKKGALESLLGLSVSGATTIEESLPTRRMAPMPTEGTLGIREEPVRVGDLIGVD